MKTRNVFIECTATDLTKVRLRGGGKEPCHLSPFSWQTDFNLITFAAGKDCAGHDGDHVQRVLCSAFHVSHVHLKVWHLCLQADNKCHVKRLVLAQDWRWLCYCLLRSRDLNQQAVTWHQLSHLSTGYHLKSLFYCSQQDVLIELYFIDFLSVSVVKFDLAVTWLNITMWVMFSSPSWLCSVEEAEVVYPDGKTCIYPVLYHALMSSCTSATSFFERFLILLSFSGLYFRSWPTGRRSCLVRSSTKKLASSKWFWPLAFDPSFLF